MRMSKREESNGKDAAVNPQRNEDELNKLEPEHNRNGSQGLPEMTVGVG